MTFSNAVSSMSGGQATKPPSWRGYVRRVDLTDPSASEYSDVSAYSVGAHVLYGGRRYVCTVAVPAPAPGQTNQFSFSSWKNIDFDHDLEFVDADAAVTVDAKYRGTVSDSGSVVYSTPSGYTALNALDAQLLNALLGDDWQLFDAADVESARTGAGGRW